MLSYINAKVSVIVVAFFLSMGAFWMLATTPVQAEDFTAQAACGAYQFTFYCYGSGVGQGQTCPGGYPSIIANTWYQFQYTNGKRQGANIGYTEYCGAGAPPACQTTCTL